MSIDLVWVALLALAAFKGFSRGLIMALFSFAALFIGLAAALKLSSTVANYFRDMEGIPSQWWPVLAFVGVFLLAALLVRIAGGVAEKTLELVKLGWVNKIGGFLVYATLYTLLFSVVLFYLSQMNIVTEEMRGKSRTYDYIRPWGPWAIQGLSRLIPALKDVFKDLQAFFGDLGNKLPA
jgi:membrane protein required for colicin V production